MGLTKEKGMNTIQRSKRDPIWGPFFRFYTRFSIPWWLFIISFVMGFAYTEINLKITEYTVRLNLGDLYNNVILGYISLNLLLSLVGVVRNMTSNYGQGLVTLRGRKLIYRRIISLPANIFEKDQPSSYVSRITADIPMASSTITSLSGAVTSIYSFVRCYMILYNYNVELTLWLMLAVPLAILTFWLCGITQYHSQKRIYGSLNEMMTFFSEHLAAVKHSKAQTMEEEERQAGFREIEKRFRADLFNGLMVSAQTSINSIYTKLCTIILLFTGRNLVEAQKMSWEGIKTGDSYLGNIQMYLAELLTQYQTVKGAQGVLGKVSALSETKPEEVKRTVEMPKENEDIKVDHVTFSYNEEKEVLHDISFTIPAGKKTAIVGNNGCGKSTLFKLLMRFYEPTSGTISYGDTNVSDIHLDEWRTSFGYVLQNSPLFSGTIRENIAYGMRGDVTEDQIVMAAKNANAYDFILDFPEAFDKEVGEGGMRLSGGQRQRIAIARAMIIDPKILLMDEATAALDYHANLMVWEATKRLMKGRTTILIAHDMADVIDADNIVVMNSGYIEAVGKHEDLMKTSKTYQEYIALQSKGGND